MKPTIGRIVHVFNPRPEGEPECLAAIVTEVHSAQVITCSAFIPNGNVSAYTSLVHKDAVQVDGPTTYWDWPARD